MRSDNTSSGNLETNEPSLSFNEIHSLLNLNAPVKTEIKLTKDAIIPSSKPVNASLWKEYHCGDTVYGYVTIKNLAKKALPFDVFYVTLEGCISIYDERTHQKVTENFLRWLI